MALTAIQTEKWAQGIEAFLTTQTVASQVLNRAMSMDGGDTFHIINPTDVTTAAVPDETSSDITYNLPTDTNVSMTKNFDNYFGLLMLDTNKMQTTLQGWERAYADNGAYQLANDLDVAVLGDHANWTNLDADGPGETGTPFTFESDLGATRLAQVSRFFALIRQGLRENKVDNKGRPFVVVDEALGAVIEEFTANRSTNLGDNTLITSLAGGGRSFPFMGFDVFVSSNLTTVSTTLHCMAGIRGYGNALGVYSLPQTFEVQRSEGRFADIIRGRVAAAYKVYRTAAVFDVEVTAGSGMVAT